MALTISVSTFENSYDISGLTEQQTVGDLLARIASEFGKPLSSLVLLQDDGTFLKDLTMHLESLPSPHVQLVVRPRFWQASNMVEAMLIGLPNVGKTTVFNLMTSCSADVSNYPFCTIVPNTAGILLTAWIFCEPCCHVYKAPKDQPHSLTIQDVAGLVKGAHEGSGLGNGFLEAGKSNVIFHVVRAFCSDEVMHVESDIDPCRDMEIVRQELLMKDHQTLDLLIKAHPGVEALTKASGVIAAGCAISSSTDWSADEIECLEKFNNQLFTVKPVAHLINISGEDYAECKQLAEIRTWVERFWDGPIVVFNAEHETKLFASVTNKIERTPMINRLCGCGFDALAS